MTAETLNIAVAGAGLIGQAHIEVIRQSPGLRLAAIADPSPAAKSLADRIGTPFFASLDALLATQRPDGIVLATPNALHVPQALQCLEAGVAVLLEKPIATTIREAEKLVARAARGGPRVLIGHHRAHSPIMTLARSALAEGLLGRLVAITGSAMFYKPDHYFEDGPWRIQPGGGPILINMIHEVHNLRMLCGEITAVQAMASHATRGFAVEDTVAISLRFAGGALGSFLLSDTAASPHSWEQTSGENPAYAHYDDQNCYVVTGTQGSLAIPTMQLHRYPRAEDRSWWKAFEVSGLALDREDPLRRQIRHFGEVIAGHAEPLVSARDGIKNLQVTEAIARAAASGQTIDLT